jgi:hypothetical protein
MQYTLNLNIIENNQEAILSKFHQTNLFYYKTEFQSSKTCMFMEYK